MPTGRSCLRGAGGAAAFGCRKSGLRHFFEVFIAPLRLRRGQGAMQGNPCYARLFADLTRTPQGAFSCPFGTIHLVSPNPIKASGGQSRAPPVAGGARRKPSEQGSARKAPRADAARPLRTALRPPNPRGFFDSLKRPAAAPPRRPATAGPCHRPNPLGFILGFFIFHAVGFQDSFPTVPGSCRQHPLGPKGPWVLAFGGRF